MRLPRPALVAWLAMVPLAAQAAPPQPTPSPSASPAAAEQAKDFRIDRTDWTGSSELSAALRRIVVRNDYGDVRARFAGDGLAVLHAVVQRLGSDADVGLNVERHGDTLAITVVSPPGRVSVGQPELPKAAVDRVDLVVWVPANAALDVLSLRGMIEARGLKSDVRAVTREGNVHVNSSAAVEAHSQGGAVTVSMGRDGSGPRRAESERGAVSVSLPATGDLRLLVDAGGELTSEIELQPAEPAAGRRRGTAVLGKGSQPVVIRSGTGRVEILRAK